MDFGDFEPLKKPAAYVSSDVLIFRPGNEKEPLRVLTCIRQGEPWAGCLTVPVGGYIDPPDKNLRTAAEREVLEESGRTDRFVRDFGLVVAVEFIVGLYGPERWHHRLERTTIPHARESVRAVRTDQSGHVRPVVAAVLAGRVRKGELRDTAEQKGFCWMTPEEIADCGKELAFDHALALYHFLQQVVYGSRPKGPLELIV